MAVAVARVGYDERLSVVDHLHELRARLIISIVAVGVAFGFCVWQNHLLLQIINRPLAAQTQRQVRSGHGPLGASYSVQSGAREVATELQSVVLALQRPGSGASQTTRTALQGVTPDLKRAIQRLSAPPQGEKPVTLGIGEPFTSTIVVCLIFALILSLPIVLYQLHGFLLPALSPEHQRAAKPMLLAIPVLFVAGIVFGYEVVLPSAIRFFENFNASQFNVLVQASQYYKFAAITLLAMGLVFQVPIAILAATHAQIISPRALKHHRRYAVLACGAVAALIPGDITTMVLETVPLYLLFESSVLLAALLDRRRSRRIDAAERRAKAGSE